LASALKLKPSYFLDDPICEVEWLAYRRHSTLTKSSMAQIQAFAEQRADAQLKLAAILCHDGKSRFPPRVPVSDESDAEEVARSIRVQWKLGNSPIESLTGTAEEHGVIVIRWNQASRFDGLCGFANTSIPVAVVSSAASDDRKRMNLAHELGHLAMRCPEGMTRKEEDKLAFRFGAAFLVPAEGARGELGHPRHLDFRHLGLLKEKWGLSMQAWIRRALDLHIISEPEYGRLNMEFRKCGWHREEPYQFKGTEEPLKMRLMTLRALAEGTISEEKAIEYCPECAQDLRSGNESAEAPITMTRLARLPLEERHRSLERMMEQADEREGVDKSLEDWSILDIECWGGDDE
jgi:Zn-dependent peptidase ImmA (M78 family)